MGDKGKQRNLRYECNTGRQGELTIDSLGECVQELRDAGVPGRARLKVQGDGVRSLGFSVTALWSAPPPAAEEPQVTHLPENLQPPDYRERNLEAIREQIDKPLSERE